MYVITVSFTHSESHATSSAWIAWFPILFYSTLYVGDLHKRSSPAATTDEQQTIIDAEATRLGSRALFYSALLALTINFILPAFVTEAAVHPSQDQSSSWWKRVCRVPRGMQIHLVTIWAISHLVFACCMFATLYVYTSRPPLSVYQNLPSFTHSVWGSTLIITITGFSWAITQWAPFSLVGRRHHTFPVHLAPNRDFFSFIARRSHSNRTDSRCRELHPSS